jgi:hypothetical protein
MSSASTTPAMVAWMRLCKVANHTNTPMGRYGHTAVTPARRIITTTAHPAAAAGSQLHAMPFA